MKKMSIRVDMTTVPGEPNARELLRALYCESIDGLPGFVPSGFVWDGSSVPAVFQGIFPRHRHPIASCRHDWRCRNAKNAVERKWADGQFEIDVGSTSWWITKKVGYLGVRIGALLGIGCRY